MSKRKLIRRIHEKVESFFPKLHDFDGSVGGSGHFRFTVWSKDRKERRVVTTSSTPSTPHSINELERDLRRLQTELNGS